MEKICRAGQATDDNILWCMHFACEITKARIQAHARSISYLLFSMAAMVT